MNPDEHTEDVLRDLDYLRGATVLDGDGEAFIVPVPVDDHEAAKHIYKRLSNSERWDR